MNRPRWGEAGSTRRGLAQVLPHNSSVLHCRAVSHPRGGLQRFLSDDSSAGDEVEDVIVCLLSWTADEPGSKFEVATHKRGR